MSLVSGPTKLERRAGFCLIRDSMPKSPYVLVKPMRRHGTASLGTWEETPEGALALVILLDQFPRNMFRGGAKAFATDAQARAIADRAMVHGFDLQVAQNLRAFFYLPLMHSEHMPDQERCVTLVTERLGQDSRQYPYALAHRDVIAKFGRFPGRNAALGRVSRAAEVEFLNSKPLF